MTFRPILAETLDDPSVINYPVVASPKLDGIRCLIIDGVAVSRSLKPIPNKFIQRILSGMPAFDGELMLDGANFDSVQSAVMSEDGEPAFTYWVFDIHNLGAGFLERYNMLVRTVRELNNPYVKVLEHAIADSVFGLANYVAKNAGDGFEGTMVRDPNGRYKHGRSTLKEALLLKIKAWYDLEGKVIGFKEQLKNTNEKEKDKRGLSKRSSKKEGKVPADTLGSLVCVMENGNEFDVGSGLTAAQRKHIWKNQDKFLGKYVTVTYQELTKDGVPRFPVYKGFRDEKDMS